MSLSQADKERLEAANVRLGGAVDDLREARRVVSDPTRTPIERAVAAGRESALSDVLARVCGIRGI